MSRMSTLTTAQRLRNALKAAGHNARRVTVRHDHSTLRVTIRDAGVSLSTVQAIADSFETVRRCQVTGEILCGGNTYVDVRYLPELIEPLAAVIVALLGPAADGETVALGGGFSAAKISRAMGATYHDEVRLAGPGFDFRNDRCVGVHHAAERIAIAYLDARAAAAEGRTAGAAA